MLNDGVQFVGYLTADPCPLNGHLSREISSSHGLQDLQKDFRVQIFLNE
jgi:hypothetical protein